MGVSGQLDHDGSMIFG